MGSCTSTSLSLARLQTRWMLFCLSLARFLIHLNDSSGVCLGNPVKGKDPSRSWFNCPPCGGCFGLEQPLKHKLTFPWVTFNRLILGSGERSILQLWQVLSESGAEKRHLLERMNESKGVQNCLPGPRRNPINKVFPPRVLTALSCPAVAIKHEHKGNWLEERPTV